MQDVLAALRAAGETTRLRLLALLARGDLTVSELTRILALPQPSISRHLKILSQAGLIEGRREGAFTFFRCVGRGNPLSRLLDAIAAELPDADPVLKGDLARLGTIRAERAQKAADYFRANAQNWDDVRLLRDAETQLRDALVSLAGGRAERLLDIGTGTGWVLAALADAVQEAIGIDKSPEMLALARSKLDENGSRHLAVRQADLYAMPFPDKSFDLVVMHQVLHFCEHPESALREAARVLAPGGRFVFADFLRHDLEELRETYKHVWLGFERTDLEAWLRDAGLAPQECVTLPNGPLSVMMMTARARVVLPSAERIGLPETTAAPVATMRHLEVQ